MESLSAEIRVPALQILKGSLSALLRFSFFLRGVEEHQSSVVAAAMAMLGPGPTSSTVPRT